ncbi:MAG: SagB/ThcOx family dehydrogenase [Steroidobacteraceae bacterium]
MHEDNFFDTLRARRTHREFASGPVSLENVSQLLHTTWGVQGYWQTKAYGKLAYKTSPSGGARHPVEVYLMALRVDGLKRGIYHYQARNNRLALLPAKASPRLATECCSGQASLGEAAALFFMTAVFCQDHVEIRQSSSVSGCAARNRPSVSDILPHGHAPRAGTVQYRCTEGLSD